jgi:HSP20 family protein
MLRTRRIGIGPSWTPLRDFARMQAEMDRLFQNVNDSYAPGFPPVNVYTSEDRAVIHAELPGVAADQVEISVLDDTVTIKGSRSAEETPEGTVAHRRERGSGDFSRSIRLPFRVEPASVDAKFENGVLEVTLPRAEADRPRRIAIASA